MEYFDVDYQRIKDELDVVLQRGVSSAEFEKEKSRVLSANAAYVSFLGATTGCSSAEVQSALADLASDHEFFDWMKPSLDQINAASRTVDTGELRVHAHTTYTLARLMKPQVLVETGVANGKSSAYLLRGLDRNGTGRLVSIDLPQQHGKELGCSGVILPEKECGWAVPRQLRHLWELRLGDARALLPKLKDEIPVVDAFFHDSLHTYDHMQFELNLAKSWVRVGGWILCDDIRGHLAFEEASVNKKTAAFGTFGVFRN